MQNKIVLITEEELAVTLAALAARRSLYLQELDRTDSTEQKLIFTKLAGDCSTAFLKVANAEWQKPIPQSWWKRLFSRRVRMNYGRVTISPL